MKEVGVNAIVHQRVNVREGGFGFGSLFRRSSLLGGDNQSRRGDDREGKRRNNNNMFPGG
jgi:hypothetical protein